MLRLSRYLPIASGVLLLVALVLVALFYQQQAIRDLVRMTEHHHVSVDRILLNTIRPRYEPYLREAATLDADALRAQPETATIGQLIATATQGVKVLKVKIYSRDGMVLFSTDPAEIGADSSGNEAVKAAVQERRTSSKLSYKDRISAFSGELFERDLVETYLPSYGANGEVIGAFEIYGDVTDVVEQIEVTSFRLMAGLTLVFAVMYGVLVIGIMRPAIRPIQQASEDAARIGPGASGLRLPTAGMPREILPLVEAMNGALERLDRALDAHRRFTADAAHELLTPLALLRAQVDTLGDAEAAGDLRQDIDAMADMVHQLLDLSEIESQGQALSDISPMDLHEVAVEVVSALAPLAVAEGKQISLTGAGPGVTIRGSPRMVGRTLRNLVENAIKHTPKGTSVEVAVGTDGTLSVIDQGEGVPPERRKAVFQRFWRGDSKTGSGTGLGLAIVKRIVDGMGGSIDVSDAPGGGACFTVRLPLIESPAM